MTPEEILAIIHDYSYVVREGNTDSAVRATHDWDTVQIEAFYLDGTHVLVGSCGGLSAVFDNLGMVLGCVEILTEHGSMFLAPDESVEVLAS